MEELDQAGRPPRHLLHLHACSVAQRARHRQPAIGEMIEQGQEEGQVARIDAFLVERQDEAAARSVSTRKLLFSTPSAMPLAESSRPTS